MDLEQAKSIIESVAGFTESDTPVGEAWETINKILDRVEFTADGHQIIAGHDYYWYNPAFGLNEPENFTAYPLWEGGIGGVVDVDAVHPSEVYKDYDKATEAMKSVEANQK